MMLEWSRLYDSGRTGAVRGFGAGHAHTYDDRLWFDADGLTFEASAGTRTSFPVLREDGDAATTRGRTLRRLSLMSYTLTRPGEPVARFDFADPAAPARLAQLRRGGHAIGFAYARDRRLTTITHTTGLRIAATEDECGRLLSLAAPWDGGDADRTILACDYDEAGDCVAMVDALGRRSAFAYDAAHRLTRRTDRRGYSFLFEYDVQGRCVASAGEDGVMGVRLRYETARRVTHVTKSDGGVWEYHYDAGGTITMVIDPDRCVRRFVKGAGGRIVAEVDPRDVTLDYVFDAGGALVGKRFATGRRIPVKGGADIDNPPPHRIASNAAEYLFGELQGTMTENADPAASPGPLRGAMAPWFPPIATMPHVPSFGVLPWYPAPSGGRHYSPFGHLVRQDLPGGGVRQWTYDANDSMQAQIDADGAVVRQSRRSWNQLHAIVDPLGEEQRYRFAREDLVNGIADPCGTITEFAYSRTGRLTGVRRGGDLRETYRRDSAGNMIEKRDAAGATLLTLTPTPDRLVAERRLASGDVHRFAYDAQSRAVGAEGDHGRVECGYDLLGRRVRDVRDGQGVVHTPEATTVFGRIEIRRVASAGGLTLVLPQGGRIGVTRLPHGVLRRDFGCGTTELCQFDVMGRCTASAASFGRTGGTWLRRWHYSFEGDLREAEDNRHGGTRYRYDAAHRLVEAVPERGEHGVFAYDPAGNLLAQPGLADVALAPANRLAAANGERFTYDQRHHIARREGPRDVRRYHYDSRDLLVRVDGAGEPWHAAYDALGRRTRAWQGEAESVFWWDCDRLAAERAPDGSLRVYVYADLRALTPSAFIDLPAEDAPPEQARVRYVLADQRGAPVLVQDQSGAVLWEARLAPYGAATLLGLAGLTLNLRFPGHYFDAATGLHGNGFRSFDPVLGRYLQSDPIGVAGGANVYAYPGNPLVRVDVRGLTGGAGGACPDETVTSPPADPNEEDTEPAGPGHGPPDPALARACGPLQKPWLVRPGEGTFPEEGAFARPGEPMDLDPQKSQTYLYVVLEDGTIAYAPQHVDEAGNESVKHTDLAENEPARTSGELNYNPAQNEWGMDDQSGRYSAQRTPAGLMGNRTQSNVDAAAQLARNSGTTSDIVPVQKAAPV